MPSYLDLALLGIVLVSALLSMVRGFTREVLAIASWGVAALAAYVFYPKLLPFLDPYIEKDTLKIIAAVAVVFFITLIVVSIVTVKLSDAILDSKVGALDRTLGFLFGAARGFLLGVVAFLFFNWLVPVQSQPAWVANAKTRPILQMTGDDLLSILPDDGGNAFLKRLKSGKGGGAGDQPPDEDSKGANPAPTQKTEAAPASDSGASPADKQGLDKLLGPSSNGKAKQ